MPAFYKSLVIPHLDYGSQSLWSPFKVTQINILEKIQHVFTKHIDGIKISPMLKGSKHIESTPIKEKLDRYIIIYIWKKKYDTSDRRGRLCKMDSVPVRHIGALHHRVIPCQITQKK